MSMRERTGSGGGKALSKQLEQPKQVDGDVSPFTYTKLLNPNADWDRDQLGDVLHWIRQAIAVVCGSVWGAIPLIGVVWLILFLALSTGLVWGYYSLYLKVDHEEFGGHETLLQEGMFASVTLFLLAWILVYSVFHF